MSHRVYVMGGYIPHGGTYMAYHLGHILHLHFGYECFIVRCNEESPQNIFDYPMHYPIVDVAGMEKNIGKNDILIFNPSFSNHCFGLRLNCTKLMYIQGFNTYNVIDGFCDHYVCVSDFVQKFIRMVYGFQPSVIPAFIHSEKISPATPWALRPANVILVSGKVYFKELVARFKKHMQARHPDIRYELVISNPLPHADFLNNLGRYRYFMTLSPCEGFGLMPLEAMAAGCAVIGFHGCGGTEFMMPGMDCQVTGYPDLDGLVDQTADLLKHPEKAAQLSDHGRQNAQAYDYASFEKRWVDFLSVKLNR